MKIIVFGARGDVGSRIVAEAQARGHNVTAVVRREAQRKMLPPSVNTRVVDVAKAEDVAGVMAGHDLAISAIRPPDGQEDALVPLIRSILDATAHSQLRVLIVGGAASLKMPDQSGAAVLTAPGFLPESVLPIARACDAQYRLCEAEARVDWSYLCPPAMLVPGKRACRYRLGSDVLLVDPDGNSGISMEDFAVALIDEAEKPQHRMARFTAAY